MAKGFNLTANLVLSGPQNIKPVVAQIRRQIGTINANVQLKFDPKANKNANILAQNVGKLSTSLNALTISANNSASAINGLSKAFSNFQRINSSTISTLNSTGKAVNKINVATQHAGDSFSKFGKEAALAVKRFAAYTIVTAGVFGFVNAIGKAVGEAIDFQHELVKIAQVSGKSTKQLTGLVDEVSRLSREWGVSSKQLINTAQILAQAGLSADDTRISLEALAKSTLAPTFKDIENTTEGAIAAMAQFKIKARDLESVLGSVNAVSAAFAVESEDLISVIRRAGGAFAAAGAGIGNFGSESERGVRQLQELSALFTSVRATTRESADSIATGLRTIFTRVQRGSTIEFLKQFNIQLAEGGKFVGQFEAFKRLSEGLKDLDTRDIRFSQIIEELGGFRQVSKVIPLLKNFAVAEEALGVAIGGQTSLTKDAISAQESIQVQITKTRERFLELIRDISQTNTFKAITQGVLSLANGFITLATYLKPVIPLITTLFAIKGFQALRQFTSGFTGAFRGVTANQLGQNAGGVVAGTGGGTAAAATATLATSQSLLKNAILANTYAINQLTQIIGASRLGGGRSPKFGPGFARGGVVPGSGNTDSVPAMLMPGEFVIRKKAVEAMGTEKLHAMNKFAKGGKQKRKTIFQSGLSKNADAPTFGAIFMEPAGKIKSEQKIKIPGSSLGKGRKAVEANLVSASLSEQVYKNAVESIGEPVKAIIRSVALDISGGLSDINDIKNIPNINAIQGSIFEGAVASLGAPIGDVIDEQRAFDYPGGLKTASYLFDSRLTDAPTDAKRTYNRDALRSIRGKIIRSLSDAGKPKAEAEKAKSGLPFSFPAGVTKGTVLTAAQLGTSFTEARKALPNDWEVIKPGGKSVFRKKFASGGSAGTDSVPAMLTPGEFVLRKEAAQKLGSSTLNDLNNADKVQRFAKGGGVARHGRMFYGDRQNILPDKLVSSLDIDIEESIENIVSGIKNPFEVLGDIIVRTSTALSKFGGEVLQNVASKLESSSSARPFTGAFKRNNTFKGLENEGGFAVDIKKDERARFSSLSVNKRATIFSALEKELEKIGLTGAKAATALTSFQKVDEIVVSFDAFGKASVNLDKTMENLAKRSNVVKARIDKINASKPNIIEGGRTPDQIAADFANRTPAKSRFGTIRAKVGGFFSGRTSGQTGPLTDAQKSEKENRKQTALLAASSVASLATQFIPQNTKAGAGIAGGISGLSQGTAIGASFGGVPGAVAGAVIGGLTGVATSLNEFNKADALAKFTKSTELASAALEKLSQNRLDKNAKAEFLGATSDVFSKGLSKISVDKEAGNASGFIARLATRRDGVNLLTGNKDTTSNVDFENLASSDFGLALSSSIKDLFTGSSSVSENLAITNERKVDNESALFKDAANQLLQSIKIGAVKAGDLNADQLALLATQDKRFTNKASKFGGTQEFLKEKQGRDVAGIVGKDIADKAQKFVDSTNKSRDALDRLTNTLDQTAREFADMTARIDLSTQDFQAGRAVKQARLNALGGNFQFAGARDTQSDVRALSNIDALSPAELKSVTERVAGRNTTLQDAAKSIQDSQQIKGVIDKVIGGISLEGFNEKSNITGQLEAGLRAAGVTVESEEVKDILENINDSLNNNRQGETQDKVLKKILAETLSGQLGTTSAKALGLQQSASKDDAARREEFARALDDSTNAIVNFTNKRLEVSSLSRDSQTKIRELSGAAPASLAELNAGFDDDLKTLAGTSSITKISRDFITLQKGLANGIIPANAESAAKAKLLGQALQRAASSSDKYNNAIQKLGEAREKTNLVKDGLRQIAFGGIEDVRNFGKGLLLSEQVKQGNLGAVNRDNVDIFGQQLQSNIERIRLLEGPEKAREFERQAIAAGLNAQGVGANQVQNADKLLLARFAEEDKLKAAAEQALKDQLFAAETQLEAARIQRDVAAKDTQQKQFVNQVVPRNTGGIIPGGGPNRDSVLAHLTPGEFVVNRNATRNNLGLLQKINGYNSGGKVSGGFSIGLSEGSINSFVNGISQFGRFVESFAQINIPERITMEVAPIQSVVTFTGESVLANEVAKQITQQVQGLVESAVRKFINPLTGQTNDGLG